MEIVDIHSHVLPGVDDGAVSVDETIAMLRIAYDAGTRKIAATPHMFLDLFHNNDFVQILDRFEQLKSDLESCQEAIPFPAGYAPLLGGRELRLPGISDGAGARVCTDP